jgi:hypothetical protein
VLHANRRFRSDRSCFDEMPPFPDLAISPIAALLKNSRAVCFISSHIMSGIYDIVGRRLTPVEQCAENAEDIMGGVGHCEDLRSHDEGLILEHVKNFCKRNRKTDAVSIVASRDVDLRILASVIHLLYNSLNSIGEVLYLMLWIPRDGKRCFRIEINYCNGFLSVNIPMIPLYEHDSAAGILSYYLAGNFKCVIVDIRCKVDRNGPLLSYSDFFGSIQTINDICLSYTFADLIELKLSSNRLEDEGDGMIFEDNCTPEKQLFDALHHLFPSLDYICIQKDPIHSFYITSVKCYQFPFMKPIKAKSSRERIVGGGRVSKCLDNKSKILYY